MSLRVWLPLNGDLHNQGIANVNVTNNSAVIDNNGKIGKCYSFGTGSSYLTIDSDILKNYTEFSFACWVNIISWNSAYATIFAVKNSTGVSWNNLIFSLLRKSSTSTLCFSISNGTNYTSTNCSTGTLSTGVWYHFVCTYKAGIIKLYQNGVLVKSYSTNIVPAFSSIANLWIGKANSNSYQTNIKLNDVRIYDHCLSVKQIKEISKGLVLHYKLDDKYTESTVNLCNGLVKGGHTVVVGDTITNTGENADTYWYIKPKEALVGGATYTVSCQLQGFSSNSDYISWGVCAQSGTNYAGSWKTYNGYNEFTFVMPAGLDGSTANIIFDDNGGVRTQIFIISNIQLEKKDHVTPYAGMGGVRNETIVYDSSGYQNNGTIIGNIQITNDSPKYAAAASFNGTSAINCASLTPEAKTISLWVKWDAIPSYQSVVFLDYKSKLGLGLMSTGILCGTSGPGSYNTFSKTGLIANTWYHFVVINPGEATGTDRKLYINGVQQEKTSNISNWTYNVDQIQIGKRSTTSDGLIGKISDVRLYTTVLSPEDIKELYQTSALLDRNQSLYVRELVEI